jgi:hypothetical protein
LKQRFDPGPKKKIRATVAKEVGMKNPAEETTVRPNQNQITGNRADPIRFHNSFCLRKNRHFFPTTIPDRLFNQNAKQALHFLPTS